MYVPSRWVYNVSRMRSDLQAFVGLVCIAAGVGGLIALNLWTVPADTGAKHQQEAGKVSTRATAHRDRPDSGAVVVVDASLEAADAASTDVVQRRDAGRADAAVKMVVQVTSTTTSTDGTVLPSIRFEPQSRSVSAETLKTVIAPIAEHVRNNFGMKVTLIGHGDAGMSAGEYQEMGRMRALYIRALLSSPSFGVSEKRVGINPPQVEGGRVVDKGIPPGSVEVIIEPRFGQPKKGGDNVP